MSRKTARAETTLRLLLALVCSAAVFADARAEDEAGETEGTRSAWQIKKCEVYRQALTEILDHVGRDGVSASFLERNREYIDSGCLAAVDACPQTDKDVEIANGLTIATMNAGAASSFSPFRCRS
ncbi:hypothetical protein ASE36_03110 [Rhizobium sp. Root274]|uniref:hypothetical protein n=1 Tax=unclassified Rhizobium TaxID=2613769 RepID=UPI000712AB60|nr:MULTISPECIES: hypothetical protein [unclassified Rhizobium]KQW31274.1 hypothetical protein ASC71_03105 [Rhizobium sp. Root1240]KRD32820.1 hypothetical protein ASE36_03110 [Rhizobium sp. Root274]